MPPAPMRAWGAPARAVGEKKGLTGSITMYYRRGDECFDEDSSVKRNKPEVLSFKVDAALLDAMHGLPNRSDFIRNAIQAALDSTCPLCKGTGILSPNQKRHWETFSEDHSVKECADCNEMVLVCTKRPRRRTRAASR
jgi:hypothetical protein